MHPIIAEELAKATQRDRLAQAARARLINEAGERPAREEGDRRSTLSGLGPYLLLRLQRLLAAAAAREPKGAA